MYDAPQNAGYIMNINTSDAIPHIEYHRDGSIWARGHMLDGVPDGFWEWFRKDGTIMRSGTFRDGKQVGDWTTYDREGKVHKVTRKKPEIKLLSNS